jgi:hypothetical protein
MPYTLNTEQNGTLSLSVKDLLSSGMKLGLQLSVPVIRTIEEEEDTESAENDYLLELIFDSHTVNIPTHFISSSSVFSLSPNSNETTFIQFESNLQNIYIKSERNAFQMNLFEKYSKQEFTIKSPKLNLLEFFALSNKLTTSDSLIQELVLKQDLVAETTENSIQQLQTKHDLLAQTTENSIEQLQTKHDLLVETTENSIEQLLSKQELVLTTMENSIQQLHSKQDLLDEKQTNLIEQLSSHTHKITDVIDLNDEISAIMTTFNSMMLSKLEEFQNKFITEHTNAINEMVTKRLEEDENLKRLDAMTSYIALQEYVHIGKVEIIRLGTQRFAWIKLITNINFPSDLPLNIITTKNNVSKTVIIDSPEMVRDRFQLQIVKSTTDGTAPNESLPFVSGVYLPKGPKSLLDFPIGNKSYEWIENEVHLQFDVTDGFDSHFNVLYKNICVGSSIVTNYDNTDWRHYYEKMLLSNIVQPPASKKKTTTKATLIPEHIKTDK